MKLRAVGTLYRHELRSSLRERTIVINGILIPIFMYPLLLWGMFTAITFVEGLNEGFTSRLAITGQLPAMHTAMRDSLHALDGVEVLTEIEGDLDAALARGELDAIVALAPLPESPVPGNFRVELIHDRTETRSTNARDRVEALVERYRAGWLAELGRDLGLDAADQQIFTVRTENISSARDVTQQLLGMMLSIFLIIMVAIGCFLPAIDTTAGERERSTWETLMTVGVDRGSIVMAKYLHVATLGILAGALNVIALMVSIGSVLRPLLVDSDLTLDVALSPLAALVMIAAAVILALTFAAAMMVVASFARSFKDGQAMVTPIFYLVFLPILLGGEATDASLSTNSALVPLLNVSMMIRDAIRGIYIWDAIAITAAVSLALVTLLLLLARRVLAFEEFLTGSFDGSFWRFARERLFARG
ncbi:MAG: ABC transporter permease subunit [Longimicrobiales bacterium]|nr:ABC transporter permease subunit [Longimicrobiales bacterium]